tara:strand:- start:44 stop:1120 length:1077 start_codon:yes stop_codon:yes gene_type:complete
MIKMMNYSKKLILISWLSFAFSGCYSQQNEPIVHDPVMIKEGNTYYLFHTGNGIQVKSSKDLKTWKNEEAVFDDSPAWILETIPDFRGSMWAPDIIEREGLFYLYYSVSAFGRNSSAIGLVTNKTLDPNSPEFKWVDQGKVIESVPGRDMWNAIDPNIIIDAENTPWMTFGSFWMGLKLVKLNPDMTSVVQDPTQEWYTVAAREREFYVDERDAGDAANPNLNYDELYSKEELMQNQLMKNGAIEAPFIFKHNNYYYLFISWDRCCRGIDSSYKILVGRSKDVRGPYLDKEGMNLAKGGGTLLAKGNEKWAAVGHQAVYNFDDKDIIIFHGYDMEDDGKPKLVIREIAWNNEWPEIEL